MFAIEFFRECSGYVPKIDCIEEETAVNLGVIRGLSLVEMEIISAAYRVENCNGIFS